MRKSYGEVAIDAFFFYRYLHLQSYGFIGKIDEVLQLLLFSSSSGSTFVVAVIL